MGPEKHGIRKTWGQRKLVHGRHDVAVELLLLRWQSDVAQRRTYVSGQRVGV